MKNWIREKYNKIVLIGISLLSIISALIIDSKKDVINCRSIFSLSCNDLTGILILPFSVLVIGFFVLFFTKKRNKAWVIASYIYIVIGMLGLYSGRHDYMFSLDAQLLVLTIIYLVISSIVLFFNKK